MMDGGGSSGCKNDARYRLNHPTLMETSVYMDESGTHDMAGMKAVGQDASFDSNHCWVWWPIKATNFGYAADCLVNGLTINYHQSSEGGNNIIMGSLDTSTILPKFSECSTYAMYQTIMEISRVSCTLFDAEKMMLWSAGRPKLSLSDIRRCKRQLSLEYESTKDELFRHRVFNQWCRRGCNHVNLVAAADQGSSLSST
jgi:hypothetical protein